MNSSKSEVLLKYTNYFNVSIEKYVNLDEADSFRSDLLSFTKKLQIEVDSARTLSRYEIVWQQKR